MRDRQHGARVLRQVLFEPLHTLGVEVVGGLVEQQEVRLLEQQLAQRDSAPLATGEVGDRLVARRAPQRVHRLLDAAVELPTLGVLDLLHQLALLGEQGVEIGVRLAHRVRDLLEPGEGRAQVRHRLLDVAAHGLGLVQWRLLLQQADRGAGRQPGVAVGGLVQAGHDLEHARLAGAVGADDTDLRPGQEGEGDVVEDHLVAVRFSHLLHGVDELRHYPSLLVVVLSNWPRRAAPSRTASLHRDGCPMSASSVQCPSSPTRSSGLPAHVIRNARIA